MGNLKKKKTAHTFSALSAVMYRSTKEKTERFLNVF